MRTALGHRRAVLAIPRATRIDRTSRTGKLTIVDSRIDLDLAAVEILRRESGWRSVGLEVGAITWRDWGDGWPAALKSELTTAKDVDSIGISVRRGNSEGSLVLFKGGWADLEFWDGANDPVLSAPGWPDGLSVEDFGELLDRFAALFI